MLEEETLLQGWLPSHPDKQAWREVEQSLSEQLRHLSDAPLSSNFTSQVMQALDAELMRQEREGRPRHTFLQWLHKLAPRLAPVSLALVVVITYFVQHQKHDHQNRIINSVAIVTSSDVPGFEILKDFDAIQNLPPAMDEDLLAALQ